MLALRVAYDALPVSTELRIMRREQLEPCHHACAELVDDRTVPEIRVHLPVRRHRPEIHDADVASRWLVDLGFCTGHGHEAWNHTGCWPPLDLRLTFGGLGYDSRFPEFSEPNDARSRRYERQEVGWK